jgi:hypothetical protein
MPVRIGCVVEGLGEVASVPILIRRVAAQFAPELQIVIPHPIRLPRSRLLKVGELEKATEFAARSVEGQGGILVILDSDDDCPAELAPQLVARVHAARSDLPSAVVLAQREFEAWFLASAESIRGHRGLPDDLRAPSNPEGIRGAKEWLDDRMSYAPTVDQSSLTATFDLNIARRAPSFDKCYREITRLMDLLRS